MVRRHRPRRPRRGLAGRPEGLALLPERPARSGRRASTRRNAAAATFSSNGFVVTALQAAWSSIRHTRGDEDAGPSRALVQAVRVGGDTDTVAAIAGQLLGARYGASAVPWRWRRVLHGWPGLRAADLCASPDGWRSGR